MEQKEIPRYATLFYDVRQSLGVNWTEYVVLDMIYHLQTKKGYCYKSAANIGKDIGEDKRTVQYILQKMIKSGYLERLTDYTVRVTSQYIDIAVMQGGTKNLYGVQNFGRGVQLSRRGVQKNVNITGAKNNSRITVDNKGKIPGKNTDGYNKALAARSKLKQKPVT